MKQIFICLGFMTMLGACGYRLTGKSVSLPGGGTELSVPLVKNQTLEAGLEDLLSQELRKQLLADGRLTLRPAAGLELSGTITKTTRVAMSFSNLGRVSVERVNVTVEFKLVRPAGGESLWKSGEVSADEEYPVGVDALATERAREQALREVSEDLAETVIELLLGDF